MQLMDKIVVYKLLNNERTDKTIKIKPNNNKKVNAWLVNAWLLNQISQKFKFKIRKACNKKIKLILNLCLLQNCFYLLIKIIEDYMKSSNPFISTILYTFTIIWDK
jgi:hypothetical protein